MTTLAIIQKKNLKDSLNQKFYAGNFNIVNIQSVSASVGAELRSKAIYVTLFALLGMLIYVGFRFEWIYGVGAVLAVFHDVMITLGLFSLFKKEIDMTVIAALLTLVGYSMNDTIVIFDRIRENLQLRRRDTLISIVNDSINQTLSRTILTSGLTLIAALALLLFGGPVLHGFSFALVVGIIVGTYSSFAVATPIMVWWKLFNDQRARRSVTPRVSTGTTPVKVK
jgi:preprotein translocase subunit SecF